MSGVGTKKKDTGGEITNYGGKSRQSLLAITLVTVLSIVSVITAYAVYLGYFEGQDVTVGGTGSGSVMYNLANSESGWESTIAPTTAGTPWYSRLEIADGGYVGPVNMTWYLQQKTSDWINVTNANVTTSILLTGDLQTIYATSNGAFGTSNYNWGANVTAAGTYRVYISVESA